MTLQDRINALPTTKDEHGDDCVSRAVVLELVKNELEVLPPAPETHE